MPRRRRRKRSDPQSRVLDARQGDRLRDLPPGRPRHPRLKPRRRPNGPPHGRRNGHHEHWRDHMTRIVGIFGSVVVCLLLVVPIATAAEPWDRDEQFVVTSGADVTLAKGQHVDVFLVFNGHARVEGDARAVVVVNGTADFVGARAEAVAAYRGNVNIDAASTVTGDIRRLDSTITTAPGATIGGAIRDFGPDVAFNWLALGSVLMLIYIAFVVSTVAAGVVVAGLAARQVRDATALIAREPVQTIGAAILGCIVVITAGILAIVTVVGIPFGIGLLALVLPALFFAGYLVAGIAIGDAIVNRMTPGVSRDRPYLAAVVGLVLVGIAGIIPPVGGLIGLVGLGAVMLLMWRTVRRPTSAASSGRGVRQVAVAAS